MKRSLRIILKDIFGVAGSDKGFETKQEVIKAAEQRMYENKKAYYQQKGAEFGARVRN